MTIIGVKIDQKFMRDLLILIIGVGLYVLSVQLFVIPNRLASNGVAGFSVLMDFVFGINPALTFFLVNVPWNSPFSSLSASAHGHSHHKIHRSTYGD